MGWRTEIGFLPGLALFTLFTTIFSLVYTWIFNHTRGSLLVAALLHGANNAWIAHILIDPNREALGLTIWSTVLWSVVAVVLVIVKRRTFLETVRRRTR